MIKVYVVSLKKDIQRREALKERFKSYDSFCMIDAVDGREFSPKEYYTQILPSFRTYNRLLSPAEAGCTLSHIKAYEAFLESGDEFGLIFEDDVIGDDEGIKKVSELCKNLDKSSVFICGCQDGLDGRFSAFGKRINSDLFLVSKHSFGSIYRAAAYVVSKESAKKLVSIHKKALCTTDLWEFLLKEAGLKMYFSDIFAHPLDLSNSNIENDRNERGYKPNLKARLKSLKFIFFSRFERFFMGYERIFEVKK